MKNRLLIIAMLGIVFGITNMLFNYLSIPVIDEPFPFTHRQPLTDSEHIDSYRIITYGPTTISNLSDRIIMDPYWFSWSVFFYFGVSYISFHGINHFRQNNRNFQDMSRPKKY